MVFPYPRRGIFPGIERHVYEYSRALAARGIDVRVVTSFWNGGPAHETYQGIDIQRIADSGTRYGRLGRLFAQHVKSFGHGLEGRPDLFEGADLVQAFIALPSARFAERAGAPLVATFYHRDRPSRLNQYLTLPSLYAMERRFFARAPLTITFSDSSRQVLIDEYGVDGASIAVTPLGVDVEKFRPAPDGGGPRAPGAPFEMLFVGPLIRRKGIDHLIEALAQVDAEEPGWKLTVVGDGPERAALAARAAELGFGSKVDFRGYVDGWGDELPGIYRQADLFVFPSLKEGFGMVIIEAMACGTPVLTTRVSAIPEVVADAGLLVEPASPDGIAQGILRLMRDDDLRRGYARAGERRVREMYSWGIVVDRTLEVFERLQRESLVQGGGR